MRKLIRTIKVAPFVNNAIYILVLSLFYFKWDLETYDNIDLFIYFSPLMAIFCLLLSEFAGLCKWHKIAVITPLISLATVLIDIYVYEFSSIATHINLAVILTILLLTLYSGYKVLWQKKD